MYIDKMHNLYKNALFISLDDLLVVTCVDLNNLNGK